MLLRQADEKDLKFLFSLRNEPTTAVYSRRGFVPRTELHKDYFKNGKKTPYIAVHKGEDIGYIIFEELTDETSVEISVAILRDYRGQGLGTLLIKNASLFALDVLGYETVVASIMPSNLRSIRAFVKAGYKCDRENSASQLLYLFTFRRESN
jgi:RimJ/RimL family protein N-acetyltransferase